MAAILEHDLYVMFKRFNHGGSPNKCCTTESEKKRLQQCGQNFGTPILGAVK